MTAPLRRQHWLWVTGPKYYTVDEVDNPDLAPPNSVEWTCGKDTKAGDLVLVYRTKPKYDIAYLLEVVSDSYVIWDGEFEGRYFCEAVSKAKFAVPLTLKEMREDPKLRDGFGPLLAQFRRSVFRVAPVWWEALRSLIVEQNPQSEPMFRSIESSSAIKEMPSERDLQDVIERRFASLDPGKGLKLYTEHAVDGTKRSGREYRGVGVGRIDLLVRDREGFVVVEIKRGLVDKKAIGQVLGYMGWVREKLAGRDEQVRGILVGSDLDPQARYALKAVPELSMKLLDELDLSR